MPKKRKTIYVIPKGTRVHFAMPNERQLKAAIAWLNHSTEHASPETAEAARLTALWLEQEKRARKERLERRLAGGRPR